MSPKLLNLVCVEDDVAWRLESGQRYGLGRDMCNHFVATHSSVSNRHLELWLDHDQVVLEDSGLAPRTIVDGELLDADTRRVGAGVHFTTGRVAWRLTRDAPEAQTPSVFTPESARRRLIEGAKQKQPYRRWTRGWRDLHGRPIAGLLGPQIGAFWFRVFAEELDWRDDPLEVYTALAEQDLCAPVSRTEARAIMDRRYLTHADEVPIVFALAEVFGAKDALDMTHSRNARVLNWLGPFPEDDVLQLLLGLRDADEVMAVALNANMPAAGIRRVHQLRPNQHYEVERWMLKTALTPTALFSLVEELGVRMSGRLAAHLIDQGSDELVEAVHEAVADGRANASPGALTSRPLPRFAAAMVRRHVRGIRVDTVHTPIRPDVIQFCERGGEAAATSLIDAFEEMPHHVAETFAMMSEEHLTALWPTLPDDLKATIEARFGTPTGELAELPKERWTHWMHKWNGKEPSGDFIPYHEGGPRMATRDGFRLPGHVERGLYAALEDTEFSVSHFHYDEALLDVRQDVEPRSAMRSMWWQLSRQHNPDRHWSRRILEAGAALMLDDRDIVEVTRNMNDMMEHELMVCSAPIVPMLLWIRAWEDYKRVPHAVQPPRGWSIDPDDEMFDEWPRETVEKRMAAERTPLPDYWDIPPGLTEDDWPRFTAWMLEHMPATLPENAADLARAWLGANAVDRTLFDVEQWRWLTSDTWVHSLRGGLIWVAFSSTRRIVFRTDADSDELVDVDGDLVVVDDDMMLHLAHPMDLDLPRRLDWAQHLAEHELMSLFDQLDTTGMRDDPTFDSVFGEEARSWAMDGWWKDWRVDSAAQDYEFSRDFGTRGRAIATVRGGHVAGLRFENVRGDEVELGELDPVVLSQTVADFERAFTRW